MWLNSMALSASFTASDAPSSFHDTMTGFSLLSLTVSSLSYFQVCHLPPGNLILTFLKHFVGPLHFFLYQCPKLHLQLSPLICQVTRRLQNNLKFNTNFTELPSSIALPLWVTVGEPTGSGSLGKDPGVSHDTSFSLIPISKQASCLSIFLPKNVLIPLTFFECHDLQVFSSYHCLCPGLS